MAPRAKKSAKPSAATKPIFAGCVISLADSGAGAGGQRNRWPEGDVARWATAWGGAFSSGIDGETTTHVLATPAQFRDAKNTRMSKARKLKGVHIVDPDWLEDSITGKKRMPEKRYSLREAQRRENARKRREERAEKGIEKGKRFVNDCLNHIYSDSTFFRYEIELTRNDEESGNVGQKYQICIWESHGKPHHYQMTAKYYSKPRDNQPAIHRYPEAAPALFDRVFDHFKHFFRKRTGIDWDERLAKVGSQPKNYWQYKPPVGGKPVGLVRGEPPSIFGDGSNIYIPRDEGSDDSSGGSSDEPAANGQTASAADETVTSPSITNNNNHGAIMAETVGTSGGADVAMEDAGSPTQDDEDVALTARIMMLRDAI